MVIEVEGLTHRYGRLTALRNLDLSVRAGSVYGLIGPNGAGKTTLLQILMGMRRATSGRARVLGKPVADLTYRDRAGIGYVAEGLKLPEWMTLAQLEAYVGPLYPTWDPVLATDLRRRFRLDAKRRIGTLSRGERMKAALLCALAARPQLLLMDEPFSGMDALVKDELVRGVLESIRGEAWTVLISSHDLSELELLVDHVGFLDDGMLRFSEPMDVLREEFQHVEVVTDDSVDAWPEGWLVPEQSGRRIRFLVRDTEDSIQSSVRVWLPAASRVDTRPASLREIFVALARSEEAARMQETA